MVCPDCGSTDTTEQEYQQAELDEVSGIYIKGLVVLCHKCKWGFNCAGTQDRRKKVKTPV